MKNWYEITNRDNGVMKISLHHEIGSKGVSASHFMQAVTNAGDASFIDMNIHSPGGNFLDGLAIYNFLKQHPAKVHTSVTGVAGSAATFPLMAGDSISMPEDAFIMIHKMQFLGKEGQSYESPDLIDIAATMDKFEQSAVNIYQKRTGMDASVLSKKMAAGAFIGAYEARDLGFIDNVTEPLGIAAKATNFAGYFNEMPFVESANQVDSIKNIKEFERYLSDLGGVSNRLATALTSRAKVIFQGDPEQPPNHKALEEITARLSSLKIPTSLNS